MIKTLSIPQELEDYLVANPDLSPSKILQSKIIEIRENRRINFAENDRLMRQVKFLQNKLWESNNQIDLLHNKIKKLEGTEIKLDDGKNKRLI